jgi:hypothetical protein
VDHAGAFPKNRGRKEAQKAQNQPGFSLLPFPVFLARFAPFCGYRFI